MKIQDSLLLVSALASLTSCATTGGGQAASASTSVRGYVIDSACAFIKDLDKPISRDCAVACAQAGSPLVLLADDGTVYWPISSTMPAVSENARLLPFAGERVVARGTSYRRGGSLALVIDSLERESK